VVFQAPLVVTRIGDVPPGATVAGPALFEGPTYTSNDAAPCRRVINDGFAGAASELKFRTIRAGRSRS
jgi:hypothetical protein